MRHHSNVRTSLRTGLFLAITLVCAAAARPAEAQEPTCVPPPSGLFAWWPLDDSAGAASAKEVIGGSDAIYLGNPVAAEGMVGGSVRLDGDGDCLAAPDEGLWDFGTAPFTFEFWVSLDKDPTGSAGQPGDVFFAHSEGPTNLDKYIFALAPGQLEFITGRFSDDTGIFAPVTPFTPVVGEWVHLAVTRVGSDYSVWINGELADTETNFANMPDASATLALGCVQEFWGGFLDGRLDEFSVYDRALTADEIADIFAAGSAGKCLPGVSTTTTTSTTTSTTTTSTTTSTTTTTTSTTTSTTTTSTTSTTLATTTTTTTTTLAPPTTTSTTSTSTSTSTTTSTSTSTTLAPPLCGDTDSSGKVTAVDALVILKAAVGGDQCNALPCVCNIDGNSSVTAADALAALRMAVGLPVTANCPC